MTQLPAPTPIAEFSGVDRRRFDEEIRPLGRPAVLRGLGADWPAVQAAKQSAEAAAQYLLSFGPRHPVPVLLGAPEIGGRFFYNAEMTGMNFTEGQVSLAAFLERLLHDRAIARPFAIAVQSQLLPHLLPGFAEANRLDLIDAAVQPRIWIGNNIQVAPHFDLTENIGVVMAGRRRFTLLPPDQLPNLYPGPLEFTPAGTPVSMVDLNDPDLDRYPLYAEAAKFAQVAELAEGDGIYIPFHWWHAVDSLERVNAFINYWWSPAQPGVGKPYDALMHALYAFRGLPEDQRAAWRMVFDNFVFGGDPVAHLPDHAKGVLGPITPEKLARMRNTLRQILGGL
ncbi:MAG: cupin-like domain-containing protein [Pseudomonadota bacterium]